MEQILAGQVAIVTGAAAGIGKGITTRFLHEGAAVVIVDFNQQTLMNTLHELQQQFEGRVHAIVADLTTAAVCAPQLVRETIERFGAPDILVNCAGIYPSTMAFDISEEEWDRVFDLNVKGYFFMARAAAAAMVEHNRSGRIVNVTSTASEIARPGVTHYCSSKAATKMMTQVLALEWAKYGIRVNALGPGLIETETLLATLTTEEAKKEHQEKLSYCPMGRVGLVEEMAEVALFFASDRSNFVTGQTLLADGGYAAGRVFKSKN